MPTALPVARNLRYTHPISILYVRKCQHKTNDYHNILVRATRRHRVDRERASSPPIAAHIKSRLRSTCVCGMFRHHGCCKNLLLS